MAQFLDVLLLMQAALAFDRRKVQLLALAAVLAGTTGCRAVTGLFRAGVWVGVIVVAILVAVGYGVSRLVASR